LTDNGIPHRGLIGFDITTCHTTMIQAQNAAKGILKRIGLDLPESGIWGRYVKGETASRMEFTFECSDQIKEVIELIVSYDRNIVRSTILDAQELDYRHRVACQRLLDHGNTEPVTYLDHVVSDVHEVQKDVTWLLIWWSVDFDRQNLWIRINQQNQWIELKDFLSESRDLV